MIIFKCHLREQFIAFIIFLIILIPSCDSGYIISQKTIVTSGDGRRFVLNRNGSWEYSGEESSFKIFIDSKEITFKHSIRARAVKCKDGDTFEVIIEENHPGLNHNETVRLLGIDAPELDREERPAKEALKYLSARLKGKRLYLVFDKDRKRDSFCRLLAFVCLKDGTCINSELLIKGYARLYTKQGNCLYDELSALQNRAIKKRIGLWEPKKKGVFIIYIYNRGNEEYLLLANSTCRNIDISEWYILDEFGDKLIIPENTAITPEEDIKLRSGKAVRDSTGTVFYFETGTIWNNNSDKAYLYTESDSLVDVYRY
ncbi:MAG: thermonuclease family protein [Candidatus Krumholzibacteriota bacterium]|nr:thermonuclease family protein [Candidatus Krumholzibacteriota bacterium]